MPQSEREQQPTMGAAPEPQREPGATPPAGGQDPRHDGPKGLAALRDARQPYLASWGGAGVSRDVYRFLSGLRWDKSIPAF